MTAHSTAPDLSETAAGQSLGAMPCCLSFEERCAEHDRLTAENAPPLNPQGKPDWMHPDFDRCSNDWWGLGLCGHCRADGGCAAHVRKQYPTLFPDNRENSTEHHFRGAGNMVPPHRFIRRCHCKYQAEKSWGYDLCEWVGGRKSWKNLGSATHPKYAADKGLKTILVRCNGCGADMLREYPPKSQGEAEL